MVWGIRWHSSTGPQPDAWGGPQRFQCMWVKMCNTVPPKRMMMFQARSAGTCPGGGAHGTRGAAAAEASALPAPWPPGGKLDIRS